MFVRKKMNKSGVVSVQIINKSSGKYELVKTVGSSSDADEIDSLFLEGLKTIPQLVGQYEINFDALQDAMFETMLEECIEQIELVGPDRVLGGIFDEIGFNKVGEPLFRDLVISRLAYPGSKLRTVDYLNRVRGIAYDIDYFYRYLDKLHSSHKTLVEDISYHHTLKLAGGDIRLVFYDVTTLYFETEQEDDLRRTGFSKDGKSQNPQIVLGLLVTGEGYPLAYQIFNGKHYEGGTLIPVVEAFRSRFKLEKLVVVADAGLLSKANTSALTKNGYQYILGARIKALSEVWKPHVLALRPASGQCKELKYESTTRLLISYSDKRATNDTRNRVRGLERLEKAVSSGKLDKKSLNNRGYNRYLKLDGEIAVTIDYEKFNEDCQWDGLKGYITNTKLSKQDVLENYRQLWTIEKAFRISKTDLRIRPIFHRLKHRIEAHICISFCAYKVYKELERRLRIMKIDMSVEKSIEVLNSIYAIEMTLPFSKAKKKKLVLRTPEQKLIAEKFKI